MKALMPAINKVVVNRIRVRRLVVRASLVLLTVAGSALAETGYRNYHNGRFGFSISYPETYRVELPENGDGAQFISGVPGVDIRASGILNINDEPAEVLFRQSTLSVQQERGVVTYATKTDTGYVVSGIIGDQVFYERIILANRDGSAMRSGKSDYIVGLYIRYPTSQKTRFDPVVRTMSQTFRPGRGMS